MALTVGIIGLPQAGKTTLFNALTRSQAPVAGFSTGTVQANRAIVNVPDERVDRLAEIFLPKKKTYATVEFVDVAGMANVEGERRESLSAEFLGHVRVADALAIVVRCFQNAAIPHPLGSVNASRDVDDLLTTLIITDLTTVEKRLERSTKAAKNGDKKLIAEVEFLQRIQHELGQGTPASRLTFTDQERAILDDLFLLTMKPRLYVANVSEGALAGAGDLLARMTLGTTDAASLVAQAHDELHDVAEVGARAIADHAEVIAVSAKLEAELNELTADEASEYLASLDLPQLGADRVIQAGYRLLDLITFLTAGEDEVRAWTVHAGARAPVAAGKIHTDIERGFIRAEVVRFEDLAAAGGFAGVREKGQLRLEGKEYIVQDGDVAHFRFNVTKG